MPSSDDATRKLRSGSREPLLRVEALCTYFPIRQGLLRRKVTQLRAVDGVDLRVLPGQILAVVGESGAGKTTLARSIAQLIPGTSGKVLLEGKDLRRLGKAELRSAQEQLKLATHEDFAQAEPLSALRSLTEHAPKLLILDEAFELLDRDVRLRLFEELRRQREEQGLTCLLFTPSLKLASQLADQIALLFAGQIVETGATSSLMSHPQHPYTRELASASASGRSSGAPARPKAGVSGCRFRERCPLAFERCATEEPTLFAVPAGLSRCFLQDPERSGQLTE